MFALQKRLFLLVAMIAIAHVGVGRAQDPMSNAVGPSTGNEVVDNLISAIFGLIGEFVPGLTENGALENLVRSAVSLISAIAFNIVPNILEDIVNFPMEDALERAAMILRQFALQ